jgi:hypothetical protein
MVEAIRSSDTSVPTGATQRNVPEYGILHSYRRENLKSNSIKWLNFVARCGMSPVKYELDFYIPEDGIRHGHSRENLKSYIALTGWTL